MAHRKIRLAIFDLDGTLVDFGCHGPPAAMLEAFSRRRIMLTMQQVRSSLGLPNYEHVRALFEMPAVGEQFEIVHGRRWTEADVLDLALELEELQLDMACRHSDLVPEALTCFEELRRRGIKIGTTTGYPRATAEQIWDALAMAGFQSECNVVADDTPTGRPAPWMIFRVMQELDVFPPESVVKIGDTAADIEEGLNAGCWSVGLIDSGNEIGLALKEWRALPPSEQDARRASAASKLQTLNPHALVSTLVHLPEAIDRLGERVAVGERA
jgi:phosphonoacetaldehyde hydrolase